MKLRPGDRVITRLDDELFPIQETGTVEEGRSPWEQGEPGNNFVRVVFDNRDPDWVWMWRLEHLTALDEIVIALKEG
jgi:hypothetical protein